MKKLKKYYKWIIIALIVILVSTLSILIYINLFQEGDSKRLEGIQNHELTKKEINSVKEKFNDFENISNIDIYTNYKIIKIFLELEEDVKFEDIKKISNEALESFSEKNLKFYDVEIFVDSLNNESEIYPKIGYKYKTDSEFTWNR